MAEGRLGRASVRVRTTVAAVVVVAIALMLGAFVLVTLVRDSLRDGVETSAEQRASSLADEIESSGLPEQPRGTTTRATRPRTTTSPRTRSGR